MMSSSFQWWIFDPTNRILVFWSWERPLKLNQILLFFLWKIIKNWRKIFFNQFSCVRIPITELIWLPSSLHKHYSALVNLLQNAGFCIFQKYLIIIMIIFYFILFFAPHSNNSWFLFEGILHALPPFFTSIIFPPSLLFF